MELKQLFLVSLVIVSVIGKKDCIRHAVYDYKTDSCKCKNNKVGDPEFCCHPRYRKSCIVKADPQLVTIANSKMSFFMPCTTPIAITSNRRKCLVQLYLGLREFELGRMYPVRATVRFTPRLRSSSIYIHLNAQSNPAIEITGNYRNIKRNFGRSVRIYFRRPRFTSVARVSHDVKTGLFKVKACRTTVIIRLASDHNVEQARVPGACVEAPRSSWRLNLDQCNVKKNLTLLSRKEIGEIMLKPLNRLDMIDYSILKRMNPKTRPLCENLGKVMRSCINHRDLWKCTDMMTRPGIKECFYHKVPGDAETRVSRAFANCMEVVCSNIATECYDLMKKTALRECAPKLINCRRL